MRNNADAYRRELDLVFQEMSDKESLAKKNELASNLVPHGMTAEILTEMRSHSPKSRSAKDTDGC